MSSRKNKLWCFTDAFKVMSVTFFLFDVDCNDTFYDEQNHLFLAGCLFLSVLTVYTVMTLCNIAKLSNQWKQFVRSTWGGGVGGEPNGAYPYRRAKGSGVQYCTMLGIFCRYQAITGPASPLPIPILIIHDTYQSSLCTAVKKSGIFLYRCKITPDCALNSPHAMIGDCIGRQQNVSCLSYWPLPLVESCDGTTTEQCSGSAEEEEEEEPSVSCKTAFSQTWLFFVETGGATLTRDWHRSISPTMLALIRHKYQHWRRYLDRSAQTLGGGRCWESWNA